MAALTEVVVQPFTAKFLNFSYVPAKSVFAHPLVVLTDPSPGRFAVLVSSLHEAWVREYCSTSLDLMRYTASSVFDTFPFPNLDSLIEIGRRVRTARDTLRIVEGQSLNDAYNRFHNPDKTDTDIQKLRQLHVEMDNAVAAAYGWTDLDLGHGFHETKQGVRYTISEPARREILARLLKLNHERYAEEVKQGLHEKKGKRGPGTVKRGSKKAKTETDAGKTLFDQDDSVHGSRSTPHDGSKDDGSHPLFE